jgi:hypothetical protein
VSAPEPDRYDQRDFLPAVSAAEWAVVVDHCVPRTFAAGTVLYERGGSDRLHAERALLFLQRGVVRGQVIDIETDVDLMPPGIIGATSLIVGDLLFFPRLVVVEEAAGLVLTSAAFDRLAAAHPHLALTVVTDLASDTFLTIAGRVPLVRQALSGRR